jgi:hypothetical protein
VSRTLVGAEFNQSLLFDQAKGRPQGMGRDTEFLRKADDPGEAALPAALTDAVGWRLLALELSVLNRWP